MRIILCLIVVFSSCSSPHSIQMTQSDIEGIQRNFHFQMECWNQGDLACYVEAYIDNGEAQTISRAGITKGKSDILAQYRKHFTPENMGTLFFDRFTYRKLNRNLAYVVGRFNLKLDDREELHQGWFSVVMKKQGSEWKMVSDHSS